LVGASAALALIDADCNGTIDSWNDPTAEQLQAWSASGYVEMDLCTKW
jgi:hypothetical protein